MFSLIFPGQGSQIVGMAKDLYDKFDYVRDYFLLTDELLKKNLSKIILDGPKLKLDQTENTQPAIFLISYSIFKVIENETSFKTNDAKFFAGHSLGEYSALCCSGSLNFEQTINLLRYRGRAMQNALPFGIGGMVAILGAKIDEIKKILKQNERNYLCYIANDNSDGQIVVSGKIKNLEFFEKELKKLNIKFIRLPVSAPFHCPLMNNATNEMKKIINDTEFKKPKIEIISNVNAKPTNNVKEIKKLLIEQIEQPVRWRESINEMINLGVNHFIEVGPGKVLTGLVKRIDRNVRVNHVNNLENAKNLSND